MATIDALDTLITAAGGSRREEFAGSRFVGWRVPAPRWARDALVTTLVDLSLPDDELRRRFAKFQKACNGPADKKRVFWSPQNNKWFDGYQLLSERALGG